METEIPNAKNNVCILGCYLKQETRFIDACGCVHGARQRPLGEVYRHRNNGDSVKMNTKWPLILPRDVVDFQCWDDVARKLATLYLA